MTFTKYILTFNHLMLWVAINPLFGTDIQLSILRSSDVQRTIDDWGITSSPLDWDGKSELKDLEQLKKFALEYHISAARLLLGGISVFNNESRTINSDFIKSGLIPEIRALNEVSVKRYVISVLTAPSLLKTRFTYKAFIDGSPVRLRVEDESDFANYVASLIGIIHDEGLSQPYAISIQSQPNVPSSNFGTPPTLAQGTIYEPEQWCRVAIKVRSVLDSKGYENVGLIGPETLGDLPEGWQSLHTLLPGPILKGIAYVSSGDNSVAYKPGVSIEPGKSKWMLSSHPGGSQNDEELLLKTFQEMKWDLIDNNVSHWFFRYAFTKEPCGESLENLVSDRSSPLRSALIYLWQHVPLGSRIYPVIANGKTANSSSCGFAFEAAAGDIVLVWVNPGPESYTCAVSNREYVAVEGQSFANSSKILKSGSDPFVIRIYPYSVFIAKLRKTI